MTVAPRPVRPVRAVRVPTLASVAQRILNAITFDLNEMLEEKRLSGLARKVKVVVTYDNQPYAEFEVILSNIATSPADYSEPKFHGVYVRIVRDEKYAGETQADALSEIINKIYEVRARNVVGDYICYMIAGELNAS